MKRLLLIALVAALVPTSAVASADPALCAYFGDAARQIMQARQRQKPMSEVMAKIAKADYVEGLRLITIRAYQLPGYTYKENQDRAVAAFRNEIEAECWAGGE